MVHEVTSPHSIDFNLPGIAELIASHELTVPIYQRSYAWHVDKEEQVKEFWDDLAHAFPGTGEYFLGTVVLTREATGDRRTVIDGQQRLATTSLLLAAIRDHLKIAGIGKDDVVQNDYLAKETIDSDGKVRRVTLNTYDDEYFGAIVSDGHVGVPDPKIPSQGRLKAAFEYLSAQVAMVAASNGPELLLDWVKFLKGRARVGVIEVPTESDAYVIFETLNDRGADLTIADLLKNYLYGRAGDKLDVVRSDWALALGALELTAADAKFVAFLRHYWSSLHGVTREKELYAAIRKSVGTKGEVVRFARNMAKAAVKYAALGNAAHDEWKTLGTGGRTDVELLVRFNLAPNRPLLLAAMDKFKKSEQGLLLTSLVAWSVRGMVLENMNSGTTEEQYCLAATKIRSGELKSRDDVRTFLAPTIPTDSAFLSAFEIARVRKNSLARYYLRALEREKAGIVEPELVPNADEAEVNLEHVMAQKADPAEWTDIATVEDVTTWAYRIGNMVLLKKTQNGNIGNKPFAEKKAILLASDLALTKEVGRKADWKPSAISVRQKALARLAVTAWPR